MLGLLTWAQCEAATLYSSPASYYLRGVSIADKWYRCPPYPLHRFLLLPFSALVHRLIIDMNPRGSTGTSATALRRLMTEYKQLTAGGPLVCHFQFNQTDSDIFIGSPDGMFTAGVHGFAG